MNQMRILVTLFILSILMTTALSPNVSSVDDAVLSTSPGYAYSSTHQIFTVNITISNVVNLNNWQMALSFNPHIINCTDVFIPADNIFSGYTTIFDFEIDNPNGSLEVFHGIWSAASVSGSGRLCSITFQALSPGISAFSFLSSTYIHDAANEPMPFEPHDGTIQIEEAGFNLYTFTVTPHGTPYNITIFSNSTITNFNFDSPLEKIDFLASGTQYTAGSCTVSIPRALLNGTFAVLVDDSSICRSMSIGSSIQHLHFNYDHSVAGSVQIQILTTLISDLSGDRRVDMRDIAIAAKAFGTTPGDDRWDPRADITGQYGYPDRKVDMRDIATVAKDFGKFW